MSVSQDQLDHIYGDLRRHAQQLIHSERPGHTLQATALVHEALCKLLQEGRDPEHPRGDRGGTGGRAGGSGSADAPPAHGLAPGAARRILFAAISMRMRQVLVEHARRRGALKGPGGWTRTPLNEAVERIEREGVDLGALDRALGLLQERDPDSAAAFQHRWFGGLSMAHLAAVLEVTPEEAQQRWSRARRLLRDLMKPGDVR